ncbi:unnamed protein product [Triticum turgidum subsp. durum]|uniref:C2 domain-containing protein n=1 Tax=Triticum turgidum subsp. durum TaxID=4567 RepID=A0A9R1P663_TRITD|nr:unnamed protein product [Triticum turgidum subsp. durum]
MLGHLAGLVKVRVTRGVNLAIRDLRSSDPYVVVRMGKQKLKTRVVRKSINPEWNDELTLSVEDPTIPVKLTSSRNGDWMRDSCLRTSSLLLVPVQDVFDKDTFFDDPMGNAELDIGPLVEAATMRIQLQGVADGTVVKKLVPNRQNCLAEESAVYLSEGTVKQDVVLRLRNVECGEVELQLQWIDIPGSKGASGF